jgi:polyisoprenyl-phosphate glycosyltransferase
MSTMNQTGGIEISVVIPVYGSAEILEELHRRVVAVCEKIAPTFELILVNDASPDRAWSVIQGLAVRDPRVRGLNLSRNFGQYPAITAGLSASRGEWVVVMDCDLQDQPEEIAPMYAKTREGYAVVVGSRQMRHDSTLRRFFSFGFYTTLGYLTGRKQDRTVANFGIYHRRVIDAVLSLQGHMRYFSVMVRWVGFRTAVVPVMHAARHGGKTGYSLKKLFGLATDIILAYSDKPLRVIIKFASIVTVLALLYMAYVIGRGLFFAPPNMLEVLLASLWLIFGLLAMILGIRALYLGKTFDEVKKRPIYIVQEEV